MLSKVFGTNNPFDEKILRLTVPQIDFILEKMAEENPKEWKFERPGTSGLDKAEIERAWFDILDGDAQAERFVSQLNPAVLRMREKEAAARREMMKSAGLTGKGLIKDGQQNPTDGINAPLTEFKREPTGNGA